MTFIEFNEKFPDEKSVVDYFIKIRYPISVKCSHCGSIRVYLRRDNIKVFDCNDCHNTFSPFKNTIFEKSSTSLVKWMYAIHLILNGKKGISALQLQREIGVTYKTAWRMLHQIRTAMSNVNQKEFFDTIIEIDETYIGGKPRKGNKDDDDDNTPKPSKRGRGTDKTPVVGVIDRYNKTIYAEVAYPNNKGQKLTANQLIDILRVVAKEGNNNIIISDEFRSYNSLSKYGYMHFQIDHTKMYSDGKGIHTNNIEGFWSILKRGIIGIYHHISLKHMQKYVAEFCFRYNNKKKNMFDMVLRQGIFGI